jgi:hypothetical protein
MAETQEDELWCDMVDALEGLDDAEREGKLLSRPATETLYANAMKTINAYKTACCLSKSRR